MINHQEVLMQVRKGGHIPADLIENAKATGSPADIAAAHVLSGLAHSLAVAARPRDPVVRLQHCDTAIRLYQTVRLDRLTPGEQKMHRRILGLAHCERGILLDDFGRRDEAVDAHQEAIAIAESIGDTKALIVGRFNLSHLHLRAGRTAEAIFEVMRSRLDSSNADSHLDLLNRNRVMTRIYLCLGFTEHALTQHAEGVERRRLGHKRGDLVGQSRESYLISLARLGYLQAVADLPDAARQTLGEVKDVAAGTKWDRVALPAIATRAVLTARDGDVDEALRLLDQDDMRDLQRDYLDDIVDLTVTRVIVLQIGKRWRASLDATRQLDDRIDHAARSQLCVLEARALARLGRWSEALRAGRRADKMQEFYHLSPEEYARLWDGHDDGRSLAAPVVADLCARQVRLRDVLAHDIRGLYSSVYLAFQSTRFAKDQATYIEQLQKFLSLVERLRDVPSNAASYLRLVDGSSEADLKPIEVEMIAKELIDHHRPSAEWKQIDLQMDPAAQSVEVLADEEMLRACLSNVISNAVKYTPQGEPVTISWRLLEPAQTVEISVADRGPGLTTDEQRLIFQQSRTFSARPTAGETSSGLGLQIVTGFLEQMNGKIRAETNPCGGSVLIVSLTGSAVASGLGGSHRRFEQRYRAPSGPSSEKPMIWAGCSSANGKASSAVAPFRTLIIDDDPDTVAAVANIITVAGGVADTAFSYDEGRRMLTTEQAFELVLCDVMMSGAPVGLDLANVARSRLPEATVAVITGLSEPFNDRLPDDCIVLRKPVRLEQITALAQKARLKTCASSAAAGQRDKSRPVPKAQHRMRLLTEVVHGQRVSKRQLQALTDTDDPTALFEGLTIASIQESLHNGARNGLRLSIKAEALLADCEVPPRIDFVWQLRNNLGLAYRDTGGLQQALETFEATLRFATQEGYVYGMSRSALNLAETYDLIGEPDKAIPVLTKATQEIGSDLQARAQLYCALGRQMAQLGASSLAIAQLQRALNLFSPLEVGDIKTTLEFLAEAYLDAGDSESVEVVLGRLNQLTEHSKADGHDLFFAQCMEAALLLANGSYEQALQATKETDPAVRSDYRPQSLPIWIDTVIGSLSHLGRHEEVIATWERFDGPPTSINPSTLLKIAASYEAMNCIERAYRVEHEAYRTRNQRNLALPSLIAVTQDVVASAATEPDDRERLASDDYATLWSRTSELLKLINDLIETTSMLLMQARIGGRTLDAKVEAELTVIEQAVLKFDSDSTGATRVSCLVT